MRSKHSVTERDKLLRNLIAECGTSVFSAHADAIVDLVRQSVYSRLAGYEDLNDCRTPGRRPKFPNGAITNSSTLRAGPEAPRSALRLPCLRPPRLLYSGDHVESVKKIAPQEISRIRFVFPS
jgi:hypothetical protein